METNNAAKAEELKKTPAAAADQQATAGHNETNDAIEALTGHINRNDEGGPNQC